MSRVEFLSVFIGIIFGLAVVDLIQKWRGLKDGYWEYSLWSIALFLVSLMNWYNLYDRIGIVVENFRMFVLVLSVPLSFYATVMIFTPEREDSDTKAYFLNKQRIFFSLLFIFLVLNWIIMVITNDTNVRPEFLNYVTGALLLLNILFKRIWLRMIALIYLLGLFGLNLYTA